MIELQTLPVVQAGGCVILHVRCGSHAHGLATATSDFDSRGVCIPPPVLLLGLERFEQWESEGNDHVIFGVTKFIRLALAGNPNIIETLFTDESDILSVDEELGTPLLQARDAFLSKQVGVRFVRYASDQLKRMKRHHAWLVDPPDRKPRPEDFGAVHRDGRHVFANIDRQKAYRAAQQHYEHYRSWREHRNRERAALETEFGYDTKHAMHLCRLLTMGREILGDGEVRVRRQDRDWLLGVRGGAMEYAELIAWAKAEMDALPELTAASALPDQPNRADAEALLIDLKLQFLDRSRSRGAGLTSTQQTPRQRERDEAEP